MCFIYIYKFYIYANILFQSILTKYFACFMYLFKVRVKCKFKPLITQQITKLCYAKLGATIYLSTQLLLRINIQYSFVFEGNNYYIFIY